MSLGQADGMSVFNVFPGFASHMYINCDEAWAGWCFSGVLVVFEVTTVKLSGLPPHLRLEPATRTSEALAERSGI
jgi:hypothetical protein